MQKIFVGLVVAIELFISITAIGGGIGLMTTNGLGMPLSWLEDSPFVSYIFPGFILTAVVGGSNLLSALLILRKNNYALVMSVFAALTVMSWIFGELYFIKQSHFLQTVYFVLSTCIIVAIFLQDDYFHFGKKEVKTHGI